MGICLPFDSYPKYHGSFESFGSFKSVEALKPLSGTNYWRLKKWFCRQASLVDTIRSFQLFPSQASEVVSLLFEEFEYNCRRAIYAVIFN